MLLLYAVIEHMPLAERLELLGLAMEMVPPGGLVVVIESPNRLVRGRLAHELPPFLLPAPGRAGARMPAARQRRLSGRLSRRRPRAGRGGRAQGNAHTLGPRLELPRVRARLRRLDQHVWPVDTSASSSSNGPSTREEMALARSLSGSRPDVPPVFSRYWLDFALSPEPRGTDELHLALDTETRQSSGAAGRAGTHRDAAGTAPADRAPVRRPLVCSSAYRWPGAGESP